MNSSQQENLVVNQSSTDTANIVPITPRAFFVAWCEECVQQKQPLLDAWESCADYTAAIQRNYPPGSVIAAVARRLGLNSHCEYYGVDAVLFRDHDRVHCSPLRETWLQNVEVAFEHENNFRGGLFQEASHLLITRCNLRVLVTYPEKHDEATELACLAKIIAGAKLTDPSFLLITAHRTKQQQDKTWTDIIWRPRIFSSQEQAFVDLAR